MADDNEDLTGHVSRAEFKTFTENHFAHLAQDVFVIKGTLIVLVPLMMVITGGIIAVACKVY